MNSAVLAVLLALGFSGALVMGKEAKRAFPVESFVGFVSFPSHVFVSKFVGIPKLHAAKMRVIIAMESAGRGCRKNNCCRMSGRQFIDSRIATLANRQRAAGTEIASVPEIGSSFNAKARSGGRAEIFNADSYRTPPLNRVAVAIPNFIDMDVGAQLYSSHFFGMGQGLLSIFIGLDGSRCRMRSLLYGLCGLSLFGVTTLFWNVATQG